MHDLDIKSLSIEALAALRDDTLKLLAEKVAARSKELEGEIARITGLTGGMAPKLKAQPKYRKGPDEWSGRGSQPAWVKAHLEGGGSLEDLKA